MIHPHLIIIAGPNGAGKSTLANELVSKYGIESFDFDKEYYARWAKFEYDPAVQRGCKEYVSGLFEKKIAEAFKNKTNFCFETNYHTKDILKHVDFASRCGFKKTLIFIGLESEALAKERVAFRVKHKGHFVPDQEIEKRFTEGLKLLDESFNRYDRVFLNESLPDFKINTCIGITTDEIVIRSQPYYLKYLPKLNQELQRGKSIDHGINM